MNLRRFNFIIVVALLSMLGVMVTQIYWVRNAFQFKEEQFSQSVGIAMKTVLNRIIELNNEIVSKQLEQKMPCNDQKTNITDVIKPYLLDSLLRMELGCLNIAKGYEYAIYNRINDKLVIGNFDQYKDQILKSEHQQTVEALFKPGKYYFSVYFPQQKTTVIRQMMAWIIVSIIFLIIVVISFWLTIRTVFRQKKISEMKSDFINNMTHEFKTPISTISIASEMLLKDGVSQSGEKIKKYASVIFNENIRLQNQVEILLQTATLENGELAFKYKETDIHHLLEETVENFEIRIHELNGRIVTHFDAENKYINIDKMHIINVFSNLIDNAIKYTNGVPEIMIRTISRKKGISIIVSDQGIGIAKENHKLVFKNLYRVHTGNIHDVKGFGIGLYYVNRIVDMHGGFVKLESEVGKGASFEVFLPYQIEYNNQLNG